MEKYLDKQFANAAKMDAPRKIKDIVRSKPGYDGRRRDRVYRLARSQGGGIRLYALVAGRWMDASLSDIEV